MFRVQSSHKYYTKSTYKEYEDSTSTVSKGVSMLTVNLDGVVYTSALARVERSYSDYRSIKEVKDTPVSHGLSLTELGPAQPMHIREIIDGLLNLSWYKYKTREKL